MPVLLTRRLRRAVFPALALVGLMLGGGCTRLQTTAHAVDAPAEAPLAPPTAPPAHHAVLQVPPALPPTAATTSAPKAFPVGLVVCAPIAAPSDTDRGRFGDGCGRWLELMAAGQPEFAQTPLWQELDRAQQEMGRSDLRLSPPDARKLAGILGATHAALGHLSGTASHGALTYQVWRLADGKPIGAPLSVTGSEAQILSGLPGLARTLASRLGVAAPRIQKTFAGSPADMALLGGLPLAPGATITDADAERLCVLAPREALAALFYLNCARPAGETERLKTARLLLAQLPENSLAWATVGWVDAYGLRSTGPALARNSGRFPQNYLFALCNVWRSRETNDRKAEMAAATLVTRAAPRNPAAWLTLAYTLGDIAEDVRKGRLAGHMSPAEWAYLNKVYPQWLAATKRAAALDPQYGAAWQRVATAATFVGDRRTADAAFWKALRLDRDKEEVYSWGLEMYQPKWGGDPASLAKVAGLAAAQHYDDVGTVATIVDSLRNAGFDAQAGSLAGAFAAQCRAAASRAPNDWAAREQLAGALGQQQDKDGAIREHQAAIRLCPDDANLYYNLGLAYDDRPRTRLAVGAYQDALRLDPAMRGARVKLGYDLKHLHQFPAAARELALAVRENPRDPDVFYALGELYGMQNQWKKAIPPLETAIRLSPYDLNAYQDLGNALDNDKQYDKGVQVCLAEKFYGQAAQDPPTEFLNDMSALLSDLYLHKHNYAGAADESRLAIGRNDNDAVAHENLGEALIGQGHKAEAQAEWRHVLALDHGDVAQAAQKMLAKYP